MSKLPSQCRKVIITGQSGINKNDYIADVLKSCGDEKIRVFDFGEAMYEEAKKSGAKIEPGKILSLPLLSV
jgi:adenylate kinase